MPDRFSTPPPVARILRFLSLYHRHRVIGLRHIPYQGRCLLVVNHSLATYDIGLLAYQIEEKMHRFARGLGDRALFRLPVQKELMAKFGAVEANPENAKRLLEAEQLVVVAPGGMREALRPKDERYRVRWERRKGFVRLALTYQTPIVLAACPDADRLYHLYDNPVTKMVYHKFRLPLPLLRGWGLSFLPRPVQLTHVLSEPMFPPPIEGRTEEEVEELVTQWHREICDRMNRLLQQPFSE